MLDDNAEPTRRPRGTKPKRDVASPKTAKVQAAPRKKAEPKPRKAQKPREFKPSKSALMAIDLLSTGAAKNISDAARQMQKSRENLTRQLGRADVKAWIVANVRTEASMQMLRAWNVKVSLLAAASETVRSDVSSEILAMGGVQAPRSAPALAVSVNVGNSAGLILRTDDDLANLQGLSDGPAYVIDLRDRAGTQAGHVAQQTLGERARNAVDVTPLPPTDSEPLRWSSDCRPV